MSKTDVALPARLDLQLPYKSGVEPSWFSGITETDVLVADARYTRAFADLATARREQHEAVAKLIDARIQLGLAIGRLQQLPAMIHDEAELARSQREHRQRLATLAHATQALEAHAQLLAAKQKRDALLPAPAPPPAPPPAPATTVRTPPGLSGAEIEELLRAMPEISPDLRATLTGILDAALEEKRRR